MALELAYNRGILGPNSCKRKGIPNVANPTNKHKGNENRWFYVDTQCIDCDVCRETAPNNFDRMEDGGYSYISKQPENEEEAEQCVEAIEACPVEAIGDDGA